MKHLFVQCVLFLCAMVAYEAKATDTLTYSYDYDAVGNRTEKKIIVMEALTSVNMLSMPRKTLEEKTEVGKIVIYPNPTSCEVNVRFEGVEWHQVDNRGESWELSLFSLDGKLLKTQQCAGSLGKLSISTFAPGMYLIRIVRGEKTSSWPLLKK